MAKHLFCLAGVANSGKTTVLKRVFSKLKKRYKKHEPRPTHRFDVKNGNDIKLVMHFDDVVMGIESEGDPGRRHRESLPLFAAMKCRIILCGCRRSGGTKDLVEEVAKKGKYRLKMVSQKWVERGRAAYNDKQADKIVAAIIKTGILP